MTDLVGKRLPIGYDDFKSIIEGNCYYIDKTLFLKDLQDNHGSVNLFLRPRRFGKSLMLSTLKYFYEDTLNEKLNAENRALFDSLKINEAPESYRSGMTAHPVIMLTLKSAKQADFDNAISHIRMDIANEFMRHKEMIEKNSDFMITKDIDDFLRYAHYPKSNKMLEEFNESVKLFSSALLSLSELLYKVYNKKSIILIDEYDVPLENAYFRNFYSQMIDFIRSFFESGLKTNPYLEFAVVTGCLRVAKESLFTGMNNLHVITMNNNHFSEYFGFTQNEVETALNDFQRPDMHEEIKRWYDGYRFGEERIYNPWSIVNILYNVRVNEPNPIVSFWANTSGNDIIRTLIDKADDLVRLDLEALMEGKPIEKKIHEDVSYADMLDSDDNLFNFLYFTGYLTAESIRYDGKYNTASLIIPNVEVLTIYERKIMEWFNKRIALKDFSGLHIALEKGDVTTIQQIIKSEISETISYYNYEEPYYHGFLTGILKGNKKRLIRSDRESGLGRYDIALVPKDWDDEVIIIEVKKAKTRKDMEGKFREAIEQIKAKDYMAGFYDDGYERFIVYAAVFCKKSVEIRLVSS